MNSSVLYNTVLNRLKEENSDLTALTGEGIFYSPELYLAFIIGKEIKKKEILIFGKKTEWIRERDFGNGGPTDFAFKTDERTYAFELKLRDTSHSYSADIEKLKGLDKTYSKFFLALVDSWKTEKDKDTRIISLENKYKDLNRLSDFISFETKQKRYMRDVCCTVALWAL